MGRLLATLLLAIPLLVGVFAAPAQAARNMEIGLQDDGLLQPHDDGSCVLVVGHEPDFSQVVHDLTGARIALKKGGLAAVRLRGSRGELSVLLRPRELDRICAPR